MNVEFGAQKTEYDLTPIERVHNFNKDDNDAYMGHQKQNMNCDTWKED